MTETFERLSEWQNLGRAEGDKIAGEDNDIGLLGSDAVGQSGQKLTAFFFLE